MSVVIDVKANDRLAAKSLQNIERHITSLNNRVEQTTKTTGQLIQAFTAFAAGGMLYQSISRVGDSLRTLEANVSMVSSSIEDMYGSMQQLKRVSIETGASVAELGDLYRKIKQSMPNEESERLLKITESIAKAMAGASDFMGAQLAIRQLTQAFAKGRFDGDEFRSVAEQLPIVVQALEEYLGVSRGQIFEMKEKGLLTSRLILESIEAYSDRIEGRYKAFSNNIALQTRRVINNIGLAFASFLHASGAYDLIVYDLRTTADLIGHLIPYFEDAGYAIQLTALGLWEAVKFITKGVAAIGIAIAAVSKYEFSKKLATARDLIADIYGIAKSGISRAFSGITEEIGGWLGGFSNAGSLLEKIGSMALTPIVFAITLLHEGLDRVILSLTTLKDKATLFFADGSTFQSGLERLKNMFGHIVPYITLLKDVSVAIWRGMLEEIASLDPWSYVVSALESFKQKVIYIFWYIYDVVVGHSIWPDTIKEVGGWADRAWGFVKDGLLKLKDGVVSIFTDVKDATTGVIDRITEKVTDAYLAWYPNQPESVKRRHYQAWNNVDRFLNVVRRTVKGFRRDIAQFFSWKWITPFSRKMEDHLRRVGYGLEKWWSSLSDDTKRRMEGIADFLSSIWTKMGKSAAHVLLSPVAAYEESKGVISRAGAYIGGWLSSAIEKTLEVLDPIGRFFSKLFSKNTAIGVAAAAGLIYAINGAISIILSNGALVLAIRKAILANIALASLMAFAKIGVLPDLVGAAALAGYKLGKVLVTHFVEQLNEGISSLAEDIGRRMEDSLGRPFNYLGKTLGQAVISGLAAVLFGKQISRLFGGKGLAGVMGRMSPVGSVLGAATGSYFGMSPVGAMMAGGLLGTLGARDPLYEEVMKKQREREIKQRILMYAGAQAGNKANLNQFRSKYGRNPRPTDVAQFGTIAGTRVIPAMAGVGAILIDRIKAMLSPRLLIPIIVGTIGTALMSGYTIDQLAKNFVESMKSIASKVGDAVQGDFENLGKTLTAAMMMGLWIFPNLYLALIEKALALALPAFRSFGGRATAALVVGIVSYGIADEVSEWLKEQFGIDNMLIATGLSVTLTVLGVNMIRNIGRGMMAGFGKYVTAPLNKKLTKTQGRLAKAGSLIGNAGAGIMRAGYSVSTGLFVGFVRDSVVDEVGGKETTVGKAVNAAGNIAEAAAYGSMFGPYGAAAAGAAQAALELGKALGLVNEDLKLLDLVTKTLKVTMEIAASAAQWLAEKVHEAAKRIWDLVQVSINKLIDIYDSKLTPALEIISEDLEKARLKIRELIDKGIGVLIEIYDTKLKPVFIAIGVALDQLANAFKSVASWFHRVTEPTEEEKQATRKAYEEGKENRPRPLVVDGDYPNPEYGPRTYDENGFPIFKADGGYISGPGGPRDDKIPAMLSNGEFVVNAQATKQWFPLLSAINSGSIKKFADGGAVYPDAIIRQRGTDIPTVDPDAGLLTTVIQKTARATAKATIAYEKEGFWSAVGAAFNTLGETNEKLEENTKAEKNNTEAVNTNTKAQKESAAKASGYGADRFKMSEEDKKNSARGYTNSLASDFSSNLSGLLKGEIGAGDFFSNILDSITSKIIDSFVEGFTNSLFESFGGIFDKLFENMLNLGENIFSNIFEGLFSNLFDGLFELFSFSSGGYVAGPGTQTSDSIPARLSNGEFVVNSYATSKWRPLLESINNGRDPFTVGFYSGGFVGPEPAGLSGASPTVVNINITGDVSRQTKQEIMRSVPEIAQAIESHRRETGL